MTRSTSHDHSCPTSEKVQKVKQLQLQELSINTFINYIRENLQAYVT